MDTGTPKLLGCSASDAEEESSDLRFDAAHVAKNLAFAVKEIAVSEELPNRPAQIYLNVTTLEGTPYCIELSEAGYRIVGTAYDRIAPGENSNKSFESVAALLESISPLYTAAFGQALIHRLTAVQQEQELTEFQTLQSIIKKLEEKKLPSSHMHAYTDLGCNFRVQAHVVDPTTMFINLGLETYVEMPLEQASKYVAARTKALEAAVNSLKGAEFQIKANIRIMYEGLREIQNIDPDFAE
ncbi:hypothetical protein BV898_11370 [Hypsibius exemplaris]|uniref:GSKIP domain-containing protein n=1 Tax=Hypsibius exemplaris TaxID=2072580 RepID=A0A1W0WGT2_HYPEX|nr:hypothetical protein BV898_11370 [Hypsibius exemplaris]